MRGAVKSGHRALGATVGAVWWVIGLLLTNTYPAVTECHPSFPPAPCAFRRSRENSRFLHGASLLTSTWSGPSWAPPDVLLGYCWRHFDCSWGSLGSFSGAKDPSWAPLGCSCCPSSRLFSFDLLRRLIFSSLGDSCGRFGVSKMTLRPSKLEFPPWRQLDF